MQIFSGQPMQLGQTHYHGLEELLEVSDYDDRGPGGAVISSQVAVIVTHLVRYPCTRKFLRANHRGEAMRAHPIDAWG